MLRVNVLATALMAIALFAAPDTAEASTYSALPLAHGYYRSHRHVRNYHHRYRHHRHYRSQRSHYAPSHRSAGGNRYRNYYGREPYAYTQANREYRRPSCATSGTRHSYRRYDGGHYSYRRSGTRYSGYRRGYP